MNEDTLLKTLKQIYNDTNMFATHYATLRDGIEALVRERDDAQKHADDWKRTYDLTLSNEVRWRRKHEAAEAISADLLKALVSLADQVTRSNAVDDHGHQLINLHALHAARAAIVKATATDGT